MRIIRCVTLVATAVAALVLFMQPVRASCPDAAIITTVDDRVDPPERTHIWIEGLFTPTYFPGYTPPVAPYSTYGPPLSPNFNAVWWEMGREVANNGSNLWPNWISWYENTNYLPNIYYYGAELFGAWGQGGVHDCVTSGACTCVLMSDVVNNVGYWAITGNNNEGAVRTTYLRQPGFDPVGNAKPIILKPIPEAFIVGSSRIGSVVRLNVDPTAGGLVDPGIADYQLGTCDCISGYRVMTKVSELSPTDRNASAWTEISGQPASGTPLGQPVTVDLTCGGTENVWLAIQLVGGGTIATSKVSANSSHVECDPTLVDDQQLRPREPRGQRTPRQNR